MAGSLYDERYSATGGDAVYSVKLGSLSGSRRNAGCVAGRI